MFERCFLQVVFDTQFVEYVIEIITNLVAVFGLVRFYDTLTRFDSRSSMCWCIVFVELVDHCCKDATNAAILTCDLT